MFVKGAVASWLSARSLVSLYHARRVSEGPRICGWELGERAQVLAAGCEVMPLGQVAHATPAPNVYWPLVHAAHTLPAPASKPALHTHSVAAVLPAPDVASLGHGSQGPGPVAALNEPARQRVHAVLRPA